MPSRVVSSAGKPLANLTDAHAAIECLGRLAEVYRARREQLAASVELTDREWEVLEEIATEHFMPSLFARRRESSAAAVSKILRQVSDKGLVVATIDKGDGRQRRYALTAKGKRVMDRLREGREAAIADVWLALDAAGLRAFTKFGTELVARLEAYAQHATDATNAAAATDAAATQSSVR